MWSVKCDCAFPSATQNEINGDDAKTLLKNGCFVRQRRRQHAERRPRPSRCSSRSKILYGPGKAANAGGVAISGLEMAQNAMRLAWTREEVDARLQRHHERASTTACVDDGRGVRPARQLRQGRQHRRLRQGRRRHARPGPGVVQLHDRTSLLGRPPGRPVLVLKRALAGSGQRAKVGTTHL